jgi:hypothetical protein
MRRTFPILIGLFLAVSAAAALEAGSATALTVKPSEMRDGETKAMTDDGRSITVIRDGDKTRVEIEGADQIETLTITREGDRIVIGPDRRRIVIDGRPLMDLERLPRFRTMPGPKMHMEFVCPKDRSTLRVPEANADQTYRCPVDGTTMEKRWRRGFTLFVDDSATEL